MNLHLVKHLSKAVTLLLIINNLTAFGQEPPRINDHNKILWIAPTATFKLNKKFDLYTEYQFRRDNWGADWMQSQIRLGLQYNISKEVSCLLGYSEIETFPYGDPQYPIAKGGNRFPEHRIYEQLIVKTQLRNLEFQHRYRLEQRWIQKQTAEGADDGWRYVNRARYLGRINIPLKGSTIDNKEWYIAIADEIFIGFGKQVRLNVFDQNRFSGLLGYKFGKQLKIEGGFFNQILQLGGPINKTVDGKIQTFTVLQYNTGAVISANFNFDLSKKGKKD